jgi:mono/diheme cytochrome c family protein
LFLSLACSRCHGNDGRGGLLGNVEVGEDMWGQKGAAADLTSGMFRGGGRPVDLYRRIAAGIAGTPMPAFGAQFEKEPEVIWFLVHFIADAGQRRRFHRLAPSSAADTKPTPTPEPSESARAEPTPLTGPGNRQWESMTAYRSAE